MKNQITTIAILFLSLLFNSSCFSQNSNPDHENGNIHLPSGKIAFMTNKDGNFNIYEIDLESGIETALTNSENDEYNNCWSPDGKSIAFISNESGNADVFVKNLETNEIKNLTDHPAREGGACWSPDSKILLFRSDRDTLGKNIFSISMTDGTLSQLTHYEHYQESPSFSPDGKYVVFTRLLQEDGKSENQSNGEIFRMDADGSNIHRLTTKEKYDSGAKYSPDGKQIAFYGFNEDNFDIFIMNADGSELFNLTNDTIDSYSPHWSPDGKWLSYSTGKGKVYDIWLIHLESRTRFQITDHNAHNDTPAWRPISDKIN